MSYILGIVIIFVQKCIISVANIFDNQLSRRTFKSVKALVVLNGIVAIPLIPLLYFLLRPNLLTPYQFLIFGIIACIEVFYQIPYYKALQNADTSVVVSLFSIGRIFVPVFAYFIVSEHLATHQYVGFILIMLCSILISVNDIKKFKFNKALFYMLPVTIIVSLQSVLQKYGLSMVPFKTFFFWNFVIPTPFYLTFLLQKTTRTEVKEFLTISPQKSFLTLYFQNLASWISGGLDAFVLSFFPITIVKSIGSFQALFVNLISSFFSKKLKVDFKEELVFKRITLFILMGIGIIITLK